MHEPKDELDGLPPGERELEAAMGALRPAPAALDRDRLLFEAGAAVGRARARRSVLAWRAAAALVAVALGTSLLRREAARPGGPAVQERIVYVEKEADYAPGLSGEAPDDEDESAVEYYAAMTRADALRQNPFPYDDGYLALRGAVSARGVNAVRDVRASFVARESLTARPAAIPAAAIPG